MNFWQFAGENIQQYTALIFILSLANIIIIQPISSTTKIYYSAYNNKNCIYYYYTISIYIAIIFIIIIEY